MQAAASCAAFPASWKQAASPARLFAPQNERQPVMEELLERLLAECLPYTAQGRLADYIPELAKADPSMLGVYVIGNDGKESWAGDCRQPFTIQSVIKPILLLQALLDNGVEAVQRRVGVEATGKTFDAINASDQSLDSGHINPMVNMGAIVICSLIHGGSYAERFQRLLELTRLLAGDERIGIDEDVYHSEKSHGSKNRALAYLLKSYGLLDDDVEEVLDCYFRACSIRVDCRALAHIGAVLSNRGRPRTPAARSSRQSWRATSTPSSRPAACTTAPASLPSASAYRPRAASAAGSWRSSRRAWASGSTAQRSTARETALPVSSFSSVSAVRCTSASSDA